MAKNSDGGCIERDALRAVSIETRNAFVLEAFQLTKDWRHHKALQVAYKAAGVSALVHKLGLTPLPPMTEIPSGAAIIEQLRERISDESNAKDEDAGELLFELRVFLLPTLIAEGQDTKLLQGAQESVFIAEERADVTGLDGRAFGGALVTLDTARQWLTAVQDALLVADQVKDRG